MKFNGEIYIFFNFSWLMTPFRDNGHLCASERHFNSVLSSLRQTVERCVRLLKGRWRRLHNMDHMNIKLIVSLIVSACALHNFCLLNDDFDPGYMIDDDGDDGGNVGNDGDGLGYVNNRNARLAGEIKRNHLKNLI